MELNGNIISKMRRYTPCDEYLQYVSEALLGGYSIREDIDPLSDELPEEYPDCIVDRTELEENMKRVDSLIVLGRTGSGKSILLRQMKNVLIEKEHLVVALNAIPHANQQNAASVLALSNLSPAIFEAYWKDFFCDPKGGSGGDLQKLRLNLEWMIRLRWFYTRYFPLSPELDHEFELTAWLKSEYKKGSIQLPVSEEETLKVLVEMITFRDALWIGKRSPHYQKVTVLVDCHQELSQAERNRLLADFEYLYRLHIPNLAIKIFSDDENRSDILALACVRKNQVPLLLMPDWQTEELRKLLAFRFKVCTVGEYYDFKLSDYNWTRLLGKRISPDLHPRLVDLLITGAMRGKTECLPSLGYFEGVPRHLLRLTRGVLYACAGCFAPWIPPPIPELNSPPIGIDVVTALIEGYWKGNEEEL